jgi:hypothetical protein
MPSFAAEYLRPERMTGVNGLSKYWNNHLMTHFSDAALTQKPLQFESKLTSGKDPLMIERPSNLQDLTPKKCLNGMG